MAVIGIVKIVVDIVMIEGVAVDTVVEDPPRSLMNPHSLHLLVGFLTALFREILIESLKISM